MKRSVTVLSSADRDLDEQARYIAENEDLDRALMFYADAERTFELAARHPLAGRVARFEHPLLRGMRVLRMPRFTKHLVFYRLSAREIQIVRVLHGARDLEDLGDA